MKYSEMVITITKMHLLSTGTTYMFIKSYPNRKHILWFNFQFYKIVISGLCYIVIKYINTQHSMHLLNQPYGPFHEAYMRIQSKSCCNSWSLYLRYNAWLRQQFCGCHNKWAGVLYAKSWPDGININKISITTKAFSREFDHELIHPLLNGLLMSAILNY